MENCLVLLCTFITASTYTICTTIVTFSASVALEIPSTMFMYTKPIPQPHILQRPISHDAIFYLCSIYDGTVGRACFTSYTHACTEAHIDTVHSACTISNMPDLVTLCIHLLYLASTIWQLPSVVLQTKCITGLYNTLKKPVAFLSMLSNDCDLAIVELPAKHTARHLQ